MKLFHNPWEKWAIIICVIVLLVLGISSAKAAVTIGSVADKMGQTWNERDGRTEEVIKGYLLEMNDFLQTGEDGGMILHYKDDTKFTMGPNTELIIDEFAFDTSVIPIEIAMNISINVGTFTYESGDVKKLGGEVELVTPTATITMQGTAFSGTVDTSGQTTIILLPDSSGDVGQVTVTNDAGSQTLTNVYTSVTVVGSDVMIKTPSALDNNQKKNLFDIDSIDDDIKEKHDQQFDRAENNEQLQKMEEAIISEEVTITEGAETYDNTSDLGTSGTETILDSKSVEESAVDQANVESDVDTSYYDDWEEDLKDWGYIDEDNQISVWDATGEQKMDWDTAKSMYAEMDQAYFDAIGCSDCTWDTINWEEVDWDKVDWDAYYDEYNDTLEKYGLTSYDVKEEDVTETVEEEATSTVVGYTWEDFDLSNEYYNNADYIAAGGPPTLTIENYCDYNGWDTSWCNQSYIDYLNAWYEDDWTLFKDYDSWEKGARKLFKKWYGWCGTWDKPEWCSGQPKPWKMASLKDKYVSEWTNSDWQKFYDNTSSWWYTGSYDDTGDDSTSLEDEYSYEDDYDIDAELELWLADIDNENDCVNWGYYWDKANASCGTEWVDNSKSETTTTTSGEILNYTTGDITQTTTTTEGDVKTSETLTGRYTTGSNTYDADVDTSVSGYSIINRYNDSHRAYLKIETADEADIQILQDKEAQHFDIGSSSSQENITIIQTD
tara:strand:- start:355 stop:2517 length:2163 start_codon:yes stop_codon:yes gene_type:complete